jgi:FKBP-type peptidyl-prolyl cis-trans isomerase SlyD
MSAAAQSVSTGKLVALTYSITDVNGVVLEQTDLPVTYIHGGATELIGGMDAAIAGKCAGDEMEWPLNAAQGFGAHDLNLTFTDDLNNVPPEFRFIGAEIPMQNEAGAVRTFVVTHIAEGKLTVDGNHPLAGKELVIHLRIHEVREPTPEEYAAATH